MTPTTRSEMIQCALDKGSLEGADSTIVAAATARALSLLLAEIKPLIGQLALHALYARSLHLADSSFERPGTKLQSTSELLATLDRDLASRDPDQALAAAQALLLALTNLLVSLIGEPLTDRLLRKAWANPPEAMSSQVKAL